MKLFLSILTLATTTAGNDGMLQRLDPASRRPAIHARAIRHHGIPAPDALLPRSLAELKNRANAGQAEASAALYAGLAKCRALREHHLDDLAFAYCGGVDDDAIAEADVWLGLAADQGDEAAMFVFATSGAETSPRNATSAERRAARIDYRQRATRHLSALANRCHVDALAALYRQRLRGGDLFAQDLRAAYVLQRELVALYAGFIASGERAALTGKLSPEELAEAGREAEVFLDERCK